MALSLVASPGAAAQGDSLCVADTLRADSAVVSLPKAKWYTGAVALGELNAMNAGIRLWDRYLLDREWSHVSWSYVKENLKMNLEWDHDFFATNMAAHPYHGSIYYNCGRSLGLSPAMSSVEVALGSWLWEIYGETDRPSTSDLFTTAFGGIIIGEMTHRISDCILDERAHGWERVWREVLAAAVNPMRGLNRVLSGRAWKRPVGGGRSDFYGHEREYSAAVSAGWLQGDYASVYVRLGFDYGNPFDEGNRGFFDHFHGEATATLLSRASVIHDMRLYGQIANLWQRDGAKWRRSFGLYQHFVFYDSDSPLSEDFSGPYRIAEAASGGVGFSCERPLSGDGRLTQHLFANVIAMGGLKSDHYLSAHRDYNFASGWSVKSESRLALGRRLQASLSADFFRFYSWKGYEKELEENPDADMFTINTQGDVCRAAALVVRPSLSVGLTGHLRLDAAGAWFWRKSSYRYYEDVVRGNGELRLGLSYILH